MLIDYFGELICSCGPDRGGTGLPYSYSVVIQERVIDLNGAP
jgi:hypothetical protein